MTKRRLSSFIDAIAEGRQPRGYRADAEDAEMVRTAIALRAARPGDNIPDPEFVATLRAQLVDQASSSPPAPSNIRAFRANRARTVLVAVAASVVLVGATVVTTDAFNHPSPTTSAGVALHSGVRTGTFQGTNGRVLGQIVVFHGRPSWVFMNVNIPNSDGSVVCKLQMTNGAVVSAGTVMLHHGRGELAKTVVVDLNRLRRATIYTPGGAALGSAALA